MKKVFTIVIFLMTFLVVGCTGSVNVEDIPGDIEDKMNIEVVNLEVIESSGPKSSKQEMEVEVEAYYNDYVSMKGEMILEYKHKDKGWHLDEVNDFDGWTYYPTKKVSEINEIEDRLVSDTLNRVSQLSFNDGTVTIDLSNYIALDLMVSDVETIETGYEYEKVGYKLKITSDIVEMLVDLTASYRFTNTDWEVDSINQEAQGELALTKDIDVTLDDISDSLYDRSTIWYKTTIDEPYFDSYYFTVENATNIERTGELIFKNEHWLEFEAILTSEMDYYTVKAPVTIEYFRDAANSYVYQIKEVGVDGSIEFNMPDIVGNTYEGYFEYEPLFGDTVKRFVKVEFTEYDDVNVFRGILYFDKLVSDDNYEKGSYYIDMYAYEDGFYIDGVEWIDKPSYYSFLDFQNVNISEDLLTITGEPVGGFAKFGDMVMDYIETVQE